MCQRKIVQRALEDRLQFDDYRPRLAAELELGFAVFLGQAALRGRPCLGGIDAGAALALRRGGPVKLAGAPG